jgi:excisionase family DNA binding protein
MVTILDIRPSPTDTLATISLEEFAQITGRGMTSIRMMARAGTLPVPCVKLGREYRIPRRAVEAWLSLNAHDDAA